MAVSPGYVGSLTLNIGGAGAAVMGIRRGSARETIDTHDTTSTASTQLVGESGSQAGVHETRIQGKARCRLSVQAQFGADGAGDPPAFTQLTIYGNIPVVYSAGDVITGNFMVEEYENSLDVDGTIDYSLSMTSNGGYTRA